MLLFLLKRGVGVGQSCPPPRLLRHYRRSYQRGSDGWHQSKSAHSVPDLRFCSQMDKCSINFLQSLKYLIKFGQDFLVIFPISYMASRTNKQYQYILTYAVCNAPAVVSSHFSFIFQKLFRYRWFLCQTLNIIFLNPWSCF